MTCHRILLSFPRWWTLGHPSRTVSLSGSCRRRLIGPWPGSIRISGQRLCCIQGAIHLDVAHQGFGEQVAKLDPSREYFLYCRTGSRSARALWVFRRAGIDRSTHLTGGIHSWTKAGLPVKKGDSVI